MQVREGFLEEVGEQGKDLGRREERGGTPGRGGVSARPAGKMGLGCSEESQDGMSACLEGKVQDFNFSLYSCVF